MVTIGELAKLGGTTVRAIRHYHAKGLLTEPPRDHSGYRRYGALDIIRLLRIRRLREIGLSVQEIGELLDKSPVSIAEALATLDEELATQQKAIAEKRKVIAQLRLSTTDLKLPEEVADLFAHPALLESGIDPELVEMEKDALLLVYALAPDKRAEIISFYRNLWEKPQNMADLADLSRLFRELEEAPEDSPKIMQFVKKLMSLQYMRELTVEPGNIDASGHKVNQVMQDYTDSLAPAQRKVMLLLSERMQGR